jgi:hypothetical protein
MDTPIPAKRRRGGQPGNQNARYNRGNPHPRKNFSNYGGAPCVNRNAQGNRGGAPMGNQNARKHRTLEADLRQRYGQQPDLLVWIEAHRGKLREIASPHDEQRDAALFAGFRGLTPEMLAEQMLEYTYGLYSSPCNGIKDNEEIAA